MALFERIVAEEGQSVPGLAAIETDPASLGESARAVEPVMWHALIGRGRADQGRRPVRAEALRHPQAVRERDRRLGARRSQVLLLREPVVPHPGLQGDAHDRAAWPLLRRRPGRPALLERAVHVPLAVQHQHVPELGAGPPLSDDLAQWRDQHACAAISTGCGPARPCSPRTSTSRATSRRSSRSSARGSATRPASTTPWSCWSARATPCRTP